MRRNLTQMSCHYSILAVAPNLAGLSNAKPVEYDNNILKTITAIIYQWMDGSICLPSISLVLAVNHIGALEGKKNL